MCVFAVFLFQGVGSSSVCHLCTQRFVCFLFTYVEALYHVAHGKCLALQESVEAQLALINTPVHPTQE